MQPTLRQKKNLNGCSEKCEEKIMSKHKHDAWECKDCDDLLQQGAKIREEFIINEITKRLEYRNFSPKDIEWFRERIRKA